MGILNILTLLRITIFILMALFTDIIKPDVIYADMGRVIASDVRVIEESQKAIILHNLEEEVLILGTDLRAEKETGIIRFIPFPSEPTVSLAPSKVFETVSQLIKNHGLKFLQVSKGGNTSTRAVEMRFHQKLGAHDLTIIKVNDSTHFREWVNDFFKKKGHPQKKEYPEIESIVHDYVKRGIVYFVFDFVEIADDTRFIEPVMYRFKSRELYYPLKTSNTFGGTGGIDLILITPGTMCVPDWSAYKKCMEIYADASTSANISLPDIESIYPDANSFFKNQNTFLQVIRYWGEYTFDNDILADVSKAFPYAIGYAEKHRGNPWEFPIEDILNEIRKKTP